MDYYIFMWDMVNSTAAVMANEQATLSYLNKIANFCLESTSELPQVLVTPIGDGQHVLFPATTDYNSIVLPFAESVGRYAHSLAGEYPGLRIRSLLAPGTLQATPLGPNGASLWQLGASAANLQPGEFKNLVK